MKIAQYPSCNKFLLVSLLIPLQAVLKSELKTTTALGAMSCSSSKMDVRKRIAGRYASRQALWSPFHRDI